MGRVLAKFVFQQKAIESPSQNLCKFNPAQQLTPAINLHHYNNASYHEIISRSIAAKRHYICTVPKRTYRTAKPDSNIKIPIITDRQINPQNPPWYAPLVHLIAL